MGKSDGLDKNNKLKDEFGKLHELGELENKLDEYSKLHKL